MNLVPYQEVQSMATAMAKSGLFGMKTPEQALALMLVAQAEGQHPATIAQDYDIIQGRAARKTNSVLARFQAAGGKVEWHALSPTKADATFSHPQGTARIEWTIEMARHAKLTGKDNWVNYPRAMLRARCIAEGVRAAYPAAIGGLLVTEEAQDLPTQPSPPKHMGAAEHAETPQRLLEEARAEADKGVTAYAEWWGFIKKDERKLLAGEHAALKQRAADADAARTVDAPPAGEPMTDEQREFADQLGDD